MKTPALPAHEVAARKRRAANETPTTGTAEQRKRSKPKAKIAAKLKRNKHGQFMKAK